MFPIPDLLHLEPRSTVDRQAVYELLDLAFLGREVAVELDRELAGKAAARRRWDAGFFAADLFLADLVRDAFVVEIDGRRHPVNPAFVERTLGDPPLDPAEIALRQAILRELDEREDLLAAARRLYVALSELVSMLKAPAHAAQLDLRAHRLDVLKQVETVVSRAVDGFASARSPLRRLHEVGLEIQRSPELRTLSDLLAYERRLASVTARIDVGGDGRVKALHVLHVDENTANPFHRSPWRRWLARAKAFLWHGLSLSQRDVFDRLLEAVFEEVAPAITGLVQIGGHLDLYLASLGFRRRAAAAGLDTCLAAFGDGPLAFEGLFNPHLLRPGWAPPVATDLATAEPSPILLVTGPNSGGKTRLLQAVAISQLLGQSGLFVPAASARLRPVEGLFVSLVERDSADQAEGRLGRELLRIRALFESVSGPAMVVLDELCSGTNPSEGVELFELVLRLLRRLEAIALVSTHFLDFSRELARRGEPPGLEVLRVEVDADHRSTYRFVPGVAATSLAAETARRLGVTFEDLSRLIDARRPPREGRGSG